VTDDEELDMNSDREDDNGGIKTVVMN